MGSRNNNLSRYQNYSVFSEAFIAYAHPLNISNEGRYCSAFPSEIAVEMVEQLVFALSRDR